MHNPDEPVRFFDDVKNLGMRECEHSSVDHVVLMNASVTKANGMAVEELAIGTVHQDYVYGAVPLVDILKFAMTQHPELVQRAREELASTAQQT